MGNKGRELAGQKFGKLTAKHFETRFNTRGKKVRYWTCECECGATKTVSAATLHRGGTRSCGCLRRGAAANRLDLLGKTFGRLTVIERAPERIVSGNKFTAWKCVCTCGNETEVLTKCLTGGNNRSCGCLRIESSRQSTGLRHGHNGFNSPTYRSWQAMRSRCGTEPGYVDITIDPRWDLFENFLADMGERPEGRTIDRIDNSGHYTPTNCRWATPLMQSNNQRTNIRLTHGGRTMTVGEWAREVGSNRPRIYYRLKMGWSVERALFEPAQNAA